jgi:hypothetical protein
MKLQLITWDGNMQLAIGITDGHYGLGLPELCSQSFSYVLIPRLPLVLLDKQKAFLPCP